MGIQEWGVIVGAAISLSLLVGPWMFLVHGQLAKLIGQVDDLRQDVVALRGELDRIRDNHLAHIYARLGKMPCPTHEVRLTAIEKRIERE